jgi:hypothetical protein
MPIGVNSNYSNFVDWQCPPVEAGGNYIKSWIDELIQNGTRWAKAQEGTKTMQRDIRILLGLDQDNSMKSNMLMPNIRTFVETISDLRQIATFGIKAEQFKQYAQTYNQALKHVYWDSEYVFNIRRSLQWAMPGGSGFCWCHFSRPEYGWGRGRVMYTDLGPYEVLPEQLPYNHDLQQAYAVSIIVPMPVAEAHARFPEFQEWLVPISRYDWKQYGSTTGLILDHWDSTRFNGQWAWENRYCIIRRTWIRDLRINETRRNLQMGVPGSTWGYTVPSYGDLLVSVNPFTGIPESRKADEEDCRVYPQLRQIITCPTVPTPMYDDTAFDTHGTIPVVQFDVNDWPWAARGYSAVRQVAGVERGRRARASEMDAIMAVRHDPPLGYDFTSGVSRTQLEKLDFLTSQGIRAGVKGDPKKAMQSMLPDSMDIAEYDWKGQEWYDSIIKSTLGLADIASMRELKMNVSDQSFDKFITNLGPMAKGIAFVMWRASSRLGMMTASNIAQYVPVEELISWIGPEAVDIETFDNDPTSLVPSHLPGELFQHQSRYTKAQRARWFMQRLGIISTPMQLLDITQMQEKMLYMFLYQKGAQIPQSTYMEKFGVQGYEALKLEWREEQLNDALWKLEVQVAIAKKAKEMGIELPQEGEGKGQGKGGGRPHSMEKPPKGAMKGSQSGNVRAVNKTS